LPGALCKAAGFGLGAPKQLDQQSTADVESFVDHGVHLGIGVHLGTGNVAQEISKPACGVDEEWKYGYADERQTPFQSEHDCQHGDGLDNIRDDVDNGGTDGVLRADDVVVQAAHQFADFGVGEEMQRHAL